MQWYYSEDVIGNLTAKTIEIVYWVVYPVDAIREYWYWLCQGERHKAMPNRISVKRPRALRFQSPQSNKKTNVLVKFS